ncbi:hypothetical protein GOV14_05710 [Candidatus Pacearchaeota archaeon]|nr:hypothetical protein [Candidatus Pacearchaeota archaeon]
MKNKKAQTWGIDLMVAVTLFTFGIMLFFIYTLNSPGDTKEKFEYLYHNGKLVMDSLMSEGYPTNWETLVPLATADHNNIMKIGILNSSNKIDDKKLQAFWDLSDNSDGNGNYTFTKKVFNTRYEYRFFLEEDMNLDGDNNPATNPVIGKDVYSNAKNLVKITRFTIYKNKPITAYLYIWEE